MKRLQNRKTSQNGAALTGFNPLALFVVLVTSVVIAGCSGGGAGTESQPNTNTGTNNSNYSGPPPSTNDVQLFKLNVWDNLVADNRCGSCHNTGGQSPTFVRGDDINLAYADANPLVNLSSPGDSRLVTKVEGGHNCWLASDSACGDIIEAYIMEKVKAE